MNAGNLKIILKRAEEQFEEFPNHDIETLNLLEFKRHYEKHSFREFLFSERWRIFMQLYILNRFAENLKFAVSYGECRQNSYEELKDANRDIAFYNVVIDKIFDSERIFDDLLSQLGLSSIITSNISLFDRSKVFNSLGQQNLKEDPSLYFVEFEDEVLLGFSENSLIIFTPEGFYFSSKETHTLASEALSYLLDELDEFMNTEIIGRGVPHEFYINWLTKNLPGKIKIRAIE